MKAEEERIGAAQDAEERATNLLQKYRDRLVESHAQALDSYDQMLLKLSGGALGLSFIFIRQFIDEDGARVVWAIGLAWVLWISSLVCTLASHYSSATAAAETISAIDKGKAPNPRSNQWTRWLNRWSGFAFGLGAVFAGFFMICNL